MGALVGCLKRGMQSRDAMGWDGCNGRTPRGESRKVVVMHEGSSANLAEVTGDEEASTGRRRTGPTAD